jgi:hypothetical protein
MSKSVRIRRGTSIDHSQFAGAEGEITVDTTIDTIRVHDGVTLGGWPVLNAAKNSEVTADILTARKIYFRNTFANQGQFPSATTYPGMMAYSQADNKTYFSMSGNWVEVTTELGLTNFISNAVPAASGVDDVSLVAPKSGSNLVIKALRAGNNVTLQSDATGIRINSAIYSGTNVSDTAGAFGVYASTDGVTFQHKFKSLRAGSGVTITPAGSGLELTIDTVLKQAFNTVRVNGVNIVTSQVNDRLNLVNGFGIALTPNTVDKTVTVGVELNVTNDSSQSGAGVLKTYSSGSFTFNKISAGTGIIVSAGANGEIVVSAPQVGTITDAVNLAPPGPTSLGVYRSKVDGTLEFYNIAAGSNITIGYDQDNKNLVIEAAVGGAAGVGTVQSGIVNNLAYYPSTGTAVGDITDGAAWDPVNQRIIANIDGTVTDITNHTTDDLDEGTSNVYWTSTRFDQALATKTTTNLSEGSNLYFTNERAQDAVSLMLQAGNPNSLAVSTATTSNSTSTATIFVTSTSGITSGQSVSGTGFPQNVTVQNVGATSFTVSPAVFAPTGTSIVIGGTLILNTSGNSTSTAQVSVTDGTNIQTGWYVTGAGILGRVTVQQVQGNLITLTPGYNATIGTGTTLTFKAVSTNGIVSTYSDQADSFTFNLDSNFLGDFVRSQFNVPSGSGLGYDPVQGRFTLSGAVTSVNGYAGSVILGVGDITGAAPTASPILTGTPRVPDLTAQSLGTQIANKNYVDATRTSITGNPLAGLTTLQALGNAINGDTLFFQTVTTSLSGKLSVGGGTMSGALLLNYLVDSASNNLIAVNKRYVDGVALVQSVNTKTGIITLFTDDIFERSTPAPSNLWFTNSRARAAISLVSSDTDVLSYNFNTGVITFNKPTTDNIQEGTVNKYYTNTLARNAITVNVTGNANFATYNALTGQITINATSDNLSQGVTNRFFTDSLARSAITLATSTSQSGLLTYNTGTGQFTLAANTSNVPEGAAGPYYFSGSRVNSAIGVSVTQLGTVAASQALVSTYNPTTGITTFTFNANTNSITEGTNNLYYTDARARFALTVSSTDTNVFNYDRVTGALTFTKPSTDGIAEGVTNKYFANSLARSAFSVTTTNIGTLGTPFVSYTTATGAWSFNLNLDSLNDGTTNKFATESRIRGTISLALPTTNDGTTPGNLITYNQTTGIFTYNNSTDSLREGSENKYASAKNVRPLVTVSASTPLAGTNQQPLVYNNGGSNGTTSQTLFGRAGLPAGELNFGLYVGPSLTWTPTADGVTTFHLTTAQDIRQTASPRFNKINLAVNPGTVGGRVQISGTDVSIDCSQGSYHEVNRSSQINNVAFTNVPNNGYFEVNVAFYSNVSTNTTFGVTNSAIRWIGANAPTGVQMSSQIGRRDFFKFYTVDGGANWYEIVRSLQIG